MKLDGLYSACTYDVPFFVQRTTNLGERPASERELVKRDVINADIETSQKSLRITLEAKSRSSDVCEHQAVALAKILDSPV